MKPKKRLGRRHRDAYRINQFQQRKLAEELMTVMALRNATLEHWQLCNKFKEDEIITVSAKAEGLQAATWAAKCAEQKQQY